MPHSVGTTEEGCREVGTWGAWLSLWCATEDKENRQCGPALGLLLCMLLGLLSVPGSPISWYPS